MTAARTVYSSINATSNMGYSQLGGHAHCAFPAAQQQNLTAFVNIYLLGQNVNTNIFNSDVQTSDFDPAFSIPGQFAGWTTPVLV